jgi:hypothetical protein
MKRSVLTVLLSAAKIYALPCKVLLSAAKIYALPCAAVSQVLDVIFLAPLIRHWLIKL